MAPSRALLRAAFSLRTPRLTPTTPIRTLTTQPRPKHSESCLHIFSPSFAPQRRLSSTSAAPTPSQTTTTSSAPQPPDYLNPAELAIFHKVSSALTPVKLEVQDISGGCGSMYALEIESTAFAGLSVIKQHKMVNKVLAEEIKGWHGVQLRTRAP